MIHVDLDTQVSTRSRGESFLPQNCNMHCLCTQRIAKIDPEKFKNHLDNEKILHNVFIDFLILIVADR